MAKEKVSVKDLGAEDGAEEFFTEDFFKEESSGMELSGTEASAGEPSGKDPSDNGPSARELSIEEAFEELDQLVKRMESDGISLEESFACYEKGIRLVRFCNDRIDRVEKKVQMLRGEGMTEEEL